MRVSEQCAERYGTVPFNPDTETTFLYRPDTVPAYSVPVPTLYRPESDKYRYRTETDGTVFPEILNFFIKNPKFYKYDEINFSNNRA